MLAWYDLVARLWSWAAIMNPSVSAFSPLPLSHWFVLWWPRSASFILFGYLPWRALSSHCFVIFSWVLFRAIFLVLFAYLVVVSPACLSGIVRSSSCLNCSACLWIEYYFLLPSCSSLSSISIGGNMFPTSPCTGTCRALQTGSPGDSVLLATATGTGSSLPASLCYGSQPTPGGSRGDLIPPSLTSYRMILVRPPQPSSPHAWKTARIGT